MKKKTAKIISASAGTGKTYTMALEYIRSLNKGVNFENILVITFTKKATAEIKERVMLFLERICLKKGNYKELIKNIKEPINEKRLLKAYEDMLKNYENIKIFNNDAFINLIFKNLVANKNNIYNYEIIDENTDEHITNVLNEILKNKKYFSIFNEFVKFIDKKELEQYKETISGIFSNRIKIYEYLDNNENLKHYKTKSFEELKSELIPYLESVEDSSLTLNGRTIYNAKNIDDISSINKKTALVKKNKNIEEEEHYQEVILPELLKIYINKNIIDYNIHYKKLAKICYEIDEKLKFSSNKFTFDDILFYTLKMKANPSEIFPNISIVMIDEFQDTNKIQFDIIAKIMNIAETLFIVGDEKQAIYSFRGGDSKLFENIEKELRKRVDDLEVQFDVLDTCYRSKSNVIDFVNEFFYNRFSNFKYDNVKYVKDGGSVNIISSEKEFDIVDDIKKNNFNSTVAVLIRKNSEIDEYQKKLEEYDMKYESIKSVKFKDDKNINSIVSVINYLVSDNLFELFRFLRSDIACYTLEELDKVIKNKKDEKIEILRENSRDFKRTFLKLFGYGRVNKKEEIVNIDKFLNLVGSKNSLRQFLDFYNSTAKNVQKENSKEKNGVSLLTIHKSKGLEYDTVYVPFKVKKENFAKYTLVELENDMLFLKKYAFLEGTVFEDFVNKHWDKEEKEFYNLIYVAFTRAESNLYIISEDKNTDELILNINGKGEVYIGENKEILEINKNEFTNEEFYKKTKYQKLISKKSSIIKEQKRKEGLAVHYFMENIVNKEDLEFAYSKFLLKYGNLVGPIKTKEIYNKCVKFIDDNSEMFDDKYKIYTEFEIFNENNEKFIIDRLNIDEENKKIYIYDYKTIKNPDNIKAYEEQIENYKNIIKAQYKDYAIFAKLLSI